MEHRERGSVKVITSGKNFLTLQLHNNNEDGQMSHPSMSR